MNSLSQFGKILSFLENIFLWIDLSIFYWSLGNSFLSIGEWVDLSNFFLSFPVFVYFLTSHCLFSLLTICVAPDFWCLDSFSFIWNFILFIDHQPIEIFRPLLVNYWSKIFREISTPKSVGEEIIEYTMSSEWLDFPEHNVIIVFSFEFSLKCFISFIHLNELLMSLLIVWIIFGVILESFLSIGIFNLLKSSCSWNP